MIRKDLPQGHFLGVALLCVTDQEIELPLIYDHPLCQPFSVSHAALGKFADNRAGLVSAIGYSVPQETIASLTLRDLSKSDSTRNAKSGLMAQPASAKCLPNQAGMPG